MNVLIPKAVGVKELVQGLNLSRTRSENIKNKIYYFLSLLVITNENYHLNIKHNGFRKISSIKMRKIMGRKDYYLILRLLQDPSNPIIESKRSWRNSKNTRGDGFCIGYRLIRKYSDGGNEFKTIPVKFESRIKKHLQQNPDSFFDNSKYEFLYNQFKSHSLSFVPSVYDYIRQFGNELMSRITYGNEYQTQMVLNLIGRWLYFIEKIENNDLWYKVSPDNHRLNSSITHLKRILRPFLLCNGQSLGIIDVSASQPYFLASVLSNEFLVGNTTGYNLRTIYPDVFNTLVTNSYITPCNNTTYYFGYTSYSGGPINTDFHVYSSSSTGLTQNTYSFMWGHFFNESEMESILRYQNLPFNEDFYKYLIKSNINCTSGNSDDYEYQRQKIKDNMMLILFDDDYKHRHNIENIKMFRNVFPGIDKWISNLHKMIGNNSFSYLLQRAESYLVLDVICREFHHKYPAAPVFTIHDAVCTYPEYLPGLKELILERFLEITGLKVGLKEDPFIANPEPKSEDIEKEWKKIRPVNSFKRFQEESYQVLSSNINRGADFLSGKLKTSCRATGS